MCATHSPRHSTVMAFVRATTLRHRTLLALLACVIALHSGQLAFAQQGGFLPRPLDPLEWPACCTKCNDDGCTGCSSVSDHSECFPNEIKATCETLDDKNICSADFASPVDDVTPADRDNTLEISATCHGEWSASCDLLFELCDYVGGFFICSSDMGHDGADKCYCTD
jgi:hypothetical protein